MCRGSLRLCFLSNRQRRKPGLSKELQNVVATVANVPIENNWDFSIDKARAMSYTANFKPVTRLLAACRLQAQKILDVHYKQF